jgi:Sigma-70 factor, region 1.1
MTVDGRAIGRLAAIDRRKGHITLADIEAIFPVDAMSPEEIGQTMVRLEDAGIDIEFDKALLRSRSDARTVNVATLRARPVLPGSAGQTGRHHDRRPHAPGSSPWVQRSLSGHRRWWKGQLGRIPVVVLVLAVLVLAIVMRS